jgi:alcohol dehydrogenase, propanol-preferring
MRTATLSHPALIVESPLDLVMAPIPEPLAGQVLIRISACGVCRTDLHLVEGELPARRLPIIPGHQAVGTVLGVGAGVSSPMIGERVGVPWLHSACGMCEFCARGEENLCPRAEFTGWHTDGGFAEYLIAQAKFVVRLPASFSDIDAAPLLCAGVIGYRALRLAGTQPGERVGLFGFGASAHLALQMLHAWDCAAFVYTRGIAHRRLAISLGAAWAGATDDPQTSLLDRIVLFAPAGELVLPALRVLRPGGTLVINAIHMSPLPPIDFSLLYGERSIRTVANATRQDAEEFLTLAEQIPIRAEVQSYPLEAANLALQHLKAGEVRGAAVLKM